ncbi:MAG: Maf family protein, partial [Maioricimonas sp. JB049]
MMHPARMIVLGSRSPRRRELLEYLVSPERVVVRPPRHHGEPGFEGLTTLEQIEIRLTEIVERKMQDVADQLREGNAATIGFTADWGAILTADTVIAGSEEGGQLTVLGQPPEDDAVWHDVVRDWFERYLLGRTHR